VKFEPVKKTEQARRLRREATSGWRVIRLWNTDVMENIDGVADTLLAEIQLSRGQNRF
jgi:very-short-patch-repair endonuclease